MRKERKASYLSLVALLLIANHPVLACEACEKQQPGLLKGITHGAGPNSNWDYVIVSIMVVITLYSLYAAVRCLAKPSDKAYEEIKNSILD